jgi:hypothetical protein
MAPALTLHHGNQQAEYVEHPTEVARKALLDAARVERGRLADQMRRFAENLADRPPAGEEVVAAVERASAPAGSRAEFAQMLANARKEQH